MRTGWAMGASAPRQTSYVVLVAVDGGWLAGGYSLGQGSAAVGLLPPTCAERGERAVTLCRSGRAPRVGWLDAWTSALAGRRGSAAGRQAGEACGGRRWRPDRSLPARPSDLRMGGG